MLARCQSISLEIPANIEAWTPFDELLYRGVQVTASYALPSLFAAPIVGAISHSLEGEGITWKGDNFVKVRSVL